MSPTDIESWKEFFIDNPLEQYIGINITLPAETKATNWVELQLKRYKTNEFGHLAAIDKETGILIGVGGLIKREIDTKPEFEIAYSIIPQYWGKGYATEIAQKMKQYALDKQLCNSVISIISIENHPSKKVALKNGMKNMGTTEYKGMKVDLFRAELLDL